jgi:hypothetical protein
MRKTAAILTLLLLALGLSGCDQEYRWHQKLTVILDTPSGPKAASSVQEGVAVKYGWWQQQWGYGGGTALHGEAVVLEVTPGHYLFALLEGTPLAWKVFLPEVTDTAEAGSTLEMLRASRVLSPDLYPLLVTFDDVNDPTTIKRVDPANLGNSFGPGYSLDSMTMTITAEPVTRGRVTQVLKCLTSGKTCVLLNSSLPYGDPMANILNSAFRRK